MTTSERHEFQTEVRQLLDLMIHSLYSHKDVFLRELVSNASDACDKRRFEALTRPELAPDGELAIDLAVDATARTLSVADNGIGMSRQEVIDNIGTIARSGSREFLALLRESQGQGVPPELIGQFGVGFYSSFMVADRITVLTRRAGEAGGTRWESAGDGYTLEDAERPAPGTTVTLHLKPVDEEDGLQDYTAAPVLRMLVKKYSDFVGYPIRLDGETLNSMKAIWTRPAAEVGEDEYKEFYKHVAHDWTEPLERVAVHIEGTFEARALLFIPSKAPFDLFFRDGTHRGVQLYVRRVFIMDDCKDLLPPWLRFVRGVVAADDLSLNVSRELLQKDRQIQAIRRHLVRRLLATLEEMLRDRRERYAEFWAEFGTVLKEGLLSFDDGADKLLDLVLAASTREGSALTTLGEYVGRMKDGQDAIYYAAGASRAALEASPHLEAFRAKGYEVLLFTDPMDELWLQRPPDFQGKKLVSVARGEVALGIGGGEDAGRGGAEDPGGIVQGPPAPPPRRAPGSRQGRAAVDPSHGISGVPGRRRRRHDAADAGDAAPRRPRGAGGEAHPRGQRRASDPRPAPGRGRARRGRSAHRRVRRAAVRAGRARRGRPAPRSRRLQQARRRPHGPRTLSPRPFRALRECLTPTLRCATGSRDRVRHLRNPAQPSGVRR